MTQISRYDNVKITIEEETMTIVVNLNEDEVNVQPSGSGKTMVIATTGGAKKMEDVSVNLTVYRKP